MAAASGDPRAAKAQGIVREVCRAVEGRVAPRRGGRAQAAGRGAPELRARPSRGRQGNRGSGRSVGTRASSPRRPRPRARHPEGTEPLGTPVRPEKRAPPGGQHRSPPSLTAPVWDSKQAVMERRGGGETRGLGPGGIPGSGRVPAHAAGTASRPASPRSWQVPSAPGDAECLGKGDLEGVGVPEGAWDAGWALRGERRGGIPRVKPRAG